MRLSAFFIGLVFCSSPFLASAAEDTMVCGRIISQNRAYGDVDVEGTGFSLRVDCNVDGEVTEKGPIAVIQKMKDGHRRSTIPWFQKEMVTEAAKKGEKNPRDRGPYVCITGSLDVSPYNPAVRKLNILSAEKMNGLGDAIVDARAKAKKIMLSRNAGTCSE